MKITGNPPAGIVTLLLLILLCSISVSGGAAEKKEKYGVGIVPQMNAGDKTEKMLYQVVGEMPEIDHVFTANDCDHLMKTLLNLKKKGRPVNYLVLAGHGSKDTPGIKWGKDDMIPEEVDPQWQKGQMEIAQKLLKNPKVSNQTPAQLQQRVREHEARLKQLEDISGVMAPDAVVLLINCSAAATEKGRKFVKSFGNVLLGKRGGHIIASKRDISLNVRSSLLQRMWTYALTGQWVRSGDMLVWGDWEVFPIKAKSTGSGKLLETLTVTNEKPEKVKTSFSTEEGKIYVIEASGVVSDWSDKNDGVDAVWRYAEWRVGPKGEVWDQLRINGKGMTELAGETIPYNPGHVYRIDFTGDGNPLEFYMSDAQGSSSDNHGSLTVKIFEK
jgi:hypothetical protein